MRCWLTAAGDCEDPSTSFHPLAVQVVDHSSVSSHFSSSWRRLLRHDGRRDDILAKEQGRMLVCSGEEETRPICREYGCRTDSWPTQHSRREPTKNVNPRRQSSTTGPMVIILNKRENGATVDGIYKLRLLHSLDILKQQTLNSKQSFQHMVQVFERQTITHHRQRWKCTPLPLWELSCIISRISLSFINTMNQLL